MGVLFLRLDTPYTQCEEHVIDLGGKTWTYNWRTGQLTEERQDKLREGWDRRASDVSWKVHSFVPDKERQRD